MSQVSKSDCAITDTTRCSPWSWSVAAQSHHRIASCTSQPCAVCHIPVTYYFMTGGLYSESPLSPHSLSRRLCISFLFLDSTWESDHTAFVFLSQFTQHHTLWVHPRRGKWQDLILLYGRVIFHVYIRHVFQSRYESKWLSVNKISC